MSVYVKLSNISYYIIICLVKHGLWQYRTGSTQRVRMVNIRFLWLLTVCAHGQYNHRREWCMGCSFWVGIL